MEPDSLKPMFIEKVIKNVETMATAIELAKGAVPEIQRIVKRLQSGKLKIAIFGAGGTGKTTLGNMLANKTSANSVLTPYQESTSVDRINLENIPGSVIIVPGQEPRQHKWDEVFSEIIDGQINLIINVVSYGYHSLERASCQDHFLFQTGMSVRDFAITYTENRRIREIEAFQALETHIKIAKGKRILMLTLVTKQDLWWQSREQMKDHYQNGEYSRLINSILLKKGSDGFQHEYFSTSLVIENFVSGDNELIWPNAEGYDERLKITNNLKLDNIINSLCDRNLK